jgi:hypothetical protein
MHQISSQPDIWPENLAFLYLVSNRLPNITARYPVKLDTGYLVRPDTGYLVRLDTGYPIRPDTGYLAEYPTNV